MIAAYETFKRPPSFRRENVRNSYLPLRFKREAWSNCVRIPYCSDKGHAAPIRFSFALKARGREASAVIPPVLGNARAARPFKRAEAVREGSHPGDRAQRSCAGSARTF